ncbi:MAG: DNA primase DnaG [Methanoculleaceae archaeon]
MYLQDTTKYLIHLTIHIEGVVDKPDVIGAIFGQTEGLLGEDLDLRELQRNGRVGRINVQIASKKGETRGEILITSSLDRAETALLAASLETIDRVGPCSAHVVVDRIEDIRTTKRRQIVQRAKELLLDHFDEEGVDTTDLLEDVRETFRIEQVELLGDEQIPAGPNVVSSDAIIVVEGRADVINLLRYGIKTAIAVEGTKIPEIVRQLCSKKTATAFVDGDRGGELILRELLQVADIDYIAHCPKGKSVEELTRKEITKALRNKVPVDFITGQRLISSEDEEPIMVEGRERVRLSEPEEMPSYYTGSAENKKAGEVPHMTLADHIREIRGEQSARVLSPDLGVLLETPLDDLERRLTDLNDNAAGLVTDQTVGQRLIDILSQHGFEFIAARSFKGVTKRPASLRLIRIA